MRRGLNQSGRFGRTRVRILHASARAVWGLALSILPIASTWTGAGATTPPLIVSTTTTTIHQSPVFLRFGQFGPSVRKVQWRLALLGYWLGTPNGVYGDSTEQAVFAFKKTAGLPRDGIVGPAMQRALIGGIRPHPHSTQGHVIEVNLYRDLVMSVINGKVQWVFNTSTGGGYTYSSGGVTSVATTPTGHFTIQREINGLVTAPLGQLWRPKYFYSGFAIHGDSYVPAVPVSHGCVRLSNEAISFVWNQNLAPIGTSVWIY